MNLKLVEIRQRYGSPMFYSSADLECSKLRLLESELESKPLESELKLWVEGGVGVGV